MILLVPSLHMLHARKNEITFNTCIYRSLAFNRVKNFNL